MQNLDQKTLQQVYGIGRRSFITPLANQLRIEQGPKKTAKVHIMKEIDESIEPCNTLFINNLNEKKHPSTIKNSLEAVFLQFGTIVDIIAMKSMKRRGQAYISFENKEEASKALQ